MASSHAHTRPRGFSQNPLSTSPTTLRARIYDRRVNHESSKETCRCPSGLSSWFLVKEISIFCPGFYLRLKERMTSIKNRGHPRGYCRRDHTTSFQFFLLQFSFENLQFVRPWTDIVEGKTPSNSARGCIIYSPTITPYNFPFPLKTFYLVSLFRNRISFFQNIFAIY